MNKIINIAWNDIKIEFTERWTLIFFLILPVVFTTIIGLGLNQMYGGEDDDSRLPLAVVQEDQGMLSQQLVNLLQNSQIVRVVTVSAEDAAKLLDDQEVPAVLTIPTGFTNALLVRQPVQLQLLEQAANTSVIGVEQEVTSIAGQMDAAVVIAHQSVIEAEKIKPFDSEDAKKNYFTARLTQAGALLSDPPAKVVAQIGAEQEEIPIASGFEQSSSGQLVTWVLVTLLGASEVFVSERLGGTLRRLLVSPTTKGQVVTGKIFGRLIQGLVQMTILVGFGAIVLKVNWGASTPALALVLIAFGLAGTAMGVMLGAFARTRGQAGNLSVLFSMLLAALGGAWWPLEVTPPAYQAVVKVLPSTWAMIGMKDVIMFGGGITDVLPEVGILLVFAVFFFAIGVWKLRFE